MSLGKCTPPITRLIVRTSARLFWLHPRSCCIERISDPKIQPPAPAVINCV